MGVINDLIRLRRVELGITQADMGERLGIGQRAYSRYENTDITPAPDRLYQMAAILGVSVEALIVPDAGITGASPTAIDRLVTECARLGFGCVPEYADTGRLKGYTVKSDTGSRFLSLSDIGGFMAAVNDFTAGYLRDLLGMP